MKRVTFNDHETFVKIHAGTWRFRNRHGTIAVTVPISCHEHFGELAVLQASESDTPRYAARATGTETWVHYYQLQAWMYPVVQEFLMTADKYNRVAKILKEAAHAVT